MEIPFVISLIYKFTARFQRGALPAITQGSLLLIRPTTMMSMYFFCLNSLRPRPNRRYFADDIFKCIFQDENEWISSRISLKFVPDVRINNIPALVQIMAWRRLGDKPLSEPVLVCLLTHICVTRPQWVNNLPQWSSFSMDTQHITRTSFFKRCYYGVSFFNTLRSRQNGRHFADDTFKRIFMNENFRIPINISLKFCS